MKALVVHPGTQYAFRLATELHRLEVLAGLHTGFAAGADGGWERTIARLPSRLREPVSNRMAGRVPARLVHLQVGLELASQARMRLARGDGQGVLHWRNERFQRAVPERALREADVVIGFDTSAWILAERCRRAGVPFVLDQSIAHPDSKIGIYERVRAEYPEWSADIQQRLPAVRAAEQIEHEQARLIIAASAFTQRTLVEHGVSPDRIRINPYGVDAAQFTPRPEAGNGPLRFIFVGSVTARKGVPLLLQAWERLRPKDAELWIVGPVADSLRRLIPDKPELRVMGGVPHREVANLMRQCDVFVFPSYFEGFGLVILEAMACGLPVITTTATAGPDVDPANEASWIVEPGDMEALLAVMDHCLNSPAATRERGKVARRIAEQNSWAAYGDRWAQLLDDLT